MDCMALYKWIQWLYFHGLGGSATMEYSVLYNFCSRVSNNIKIKEKDRKYEYQLNYVRAFHIIRNYLKEKGGKNPPDIESLIAKEILPIRPNRQNERKVKAKSPVSFNYRYD